MDLGIGINWDKILPDSKVIQFHGEYAWKKIGDFYPPLWGGFNRTKLKEWLKNTRPDYDKFINEEKSVGKIKLYDEKGLIYPNFCAVADETGSEGILADGSHRFIDCNYLIIKGKNLKEDIKKCRLDVLCIKNLNEVLTPIDFQAID